MTISADISNERDNLINLYFRAKKGERAKILARLVVLDEEAEADDKNGYMAKSSRNSKD